MNAIELIKEKYNTFNKKQRRIADYILANADACGFMTLHKLAGAAETTDATILSFSRKLGFKGFADMKHSIQQEICSRCALISGGRERQPGICAVSPWGAAAYTSR